jgi:signal peptidase
MSLRDDPLLQRFIRPETEVGKLFRDVTVTIVTVSTIFLIIFVISGVWPPFVTVTSGSMEPEMSRGDLILLELTTADSPPGGYGDTGIVPVDRAESAGHTAFGDPGDVIIYRPDGSTSETPIIHRAHFWVDEGEDWYERANPEFLGGAIDCTELANCPAPNAGFVTKGDANQVYDQALAFSTPVEPDWIIAEANFRIPYIGWIRIILL